MTGRATSNRVPHEANYGAIQALCEEWKLACSDDECRCAVIEAGWRIGFEDGQRYVAAMKERGLW